MNPHFKVMFSSSYSLSLFRSLGSLCLSFYPTHTLSQTLFIFLVFALNKLHLSAYMSLCFFASLFLCLSVSLFLCFSVFLSLCLNLFHTLTHALSLSHLPILSVVSQLSKLKQLGMQAVFFLNKIKNTVI